MDISADRSRPLGLQEIDGIKVYRQEIWFEFKGAVLIKGVKKLLKQIKPDIVHTYEPVQLTPVLGGIYKKLGYRLFVDHQMFELPRTILGRLYFWFISQFFSRYLIKKGDKILFPTDASLQFSEKRFKLEPKKITMVPLGYDSDFFYFNSEARQEVRGENGVSDQDILLVTAGRISREKNLGFVLKAMAEVKDKHCFKFLLIGSGDQAVLNALKDEVKMLGLDQSVFFQGFVPNKDLSRYYSAADFGVWPDLPSITIIEAIGCYLPLILPDSKTVNHLIANDNGFSFKNSNLRSLVELLEKLSTGEFSRPNLNQELKKAANVFNYLTVAEKLTRLS